MTARNPKKANFFHPTEGFRQTFYLMLFISAFLELIKYQQLLV